MKKARTPRVDLGQGWRSAAASFNVLVVTRLLCFIALSLAGCVDSTDRLGEEPIDLGGIPLYPISGRVVHADGTPAPGALIYGLSDGQTQPFGRTDNDGFFSYEIYAPRLLARFGFNEVEIAGVKPGEHVLITLVPTEERPETLDIMGVGMERLFHLNGQLRFADARDDRVFAWQQREVAGTFGLLSIDLETEEVEVLHEEPVEALASGSLEFFDDRFLLVWLTDAAGIGSNGMKRWRTLIIHLESATIFASTDWATHRLPKPRWRAENGIVDLLVYVEGNADNGQKAIIHHRFDVVHGFGSEAYLPLSSPHEPQMAGFVGDTFYFCLEDEGVFALDLSNSLLRPLPELSNEGTAPSCRAAWNTGDALAWVDVDSANRVVFFEDEGRTINHAETGLSLETDGLRARGVEQMALLTRGSFSRGPDWSVFFNGQSKLAYDFRQLRADAGFRLPWIDPPRLWKNGRDITTTRHDETGAYRIRWRDDARELRVESVPGNIDPERCSPEGWPGEDPEQAIEWLSCQKEAEGLTIKRDIFAAHTGERRSFFSSRLLFQRVSNRFVYASSNQGRNGLIWFDIDAER